MSRFFVRREVGREAATSVGKPYLLGEAGLVRTLRSTLPNSVPAQPFCAIVLRLAIGGNSFPDGIALCAVNPASGWHGTVHRPLYSGG